MFNQLKTPGIADLGNFVNLFFMFSQPHVEISLSTNNETIISAVMVFAEGIFEGETHVLHPKDSEVTSRLDVALYPPRDVPVDIHIKVKIFYTLTDFASNGLYLLILHHIYLYNEYFMLKGGG